MILKKETEKIIKNAVISKLNKSVGRENWDIPHTLLAVEWMKKIIQNEGGNKKILIPAIYFHDSGYPLVKKGYNYNEVMAAKPDHAKNGAEFAKTVLEKIKEFNEEEIEEIVYLVTNHDKHKNIESFHRQLIFEADGLAQIDYTYIKPNLDKESHLKFLEKYFKTERPPERWKTKTGKKNMKILLKKAYKYNEKMK
jgi:hypothetical protein